MGFFGLGNGNVRMVQTEPGIIVGPISSFLGFILDFIYNIIEGIAGFAALGLSIIFFTILVNILIMPIGLKMQRSMRQMKALKPQQDAINAKYKDKKDRESQQQKAMEIQKLFKDNNVSPLGGCLPMLLQMPIFITLFAMFQRPYLYISQLHQVYARIADQIMAVPNFHMYIINTPSLGIDKMPGNIDPNYFFLGYEPHLLRLFNVYTTADWQTLLSVLPHQYMDIDYINYLLYQKEAIESFIGISLIENAGFLWPGIVIAILSGLTTFLSTRLMMHNQPQPSTDDSTATAMAAQQKMMTYFMPVMMVVFTVMAPGAVGLYWIVNNLSRIGQNWGLNKWIDRQEKKADQ